VKVARRFIAGFGKKKRRASQQDALLFSSTRAALINLIRPYGTGVLLGHNPGNKLPGYSQKSLRDFALPTPLSDS